jgi:hypothetical protein
MNVHVRVRKCLDASCGEQSVFYDGLSSDIDLDYKMNPHGILCPRCNEWTEWWSDVPEGALFVCDGDELWAK